MSTQRLAILVGLVLAVGIPLYYVVIKKRAAASLDDLLAERFRTPRACPVAMIDVPKGGRITCEAAYQDGEDPKTLVVLGLWDRGTVHAPQGIASVYQKVSGVFRTGADEAWLAHMREQPDVIAAIAVDQHDRARGGLVMWSGLPDRASVLAHLEAAR